MVFIVNVIKHFLCSFDKHEKSEHLTSMGTFEYHVTGVCLQLVWDRVENKTLKPIAFIIQSKVNLVEILASGGWFSKC